MSARTRAWVESWDRVKGKPEEELKSYLVGKCRNGFQVAKKPSRDQRDAWVTLLAEPGDAATDLSPLAMRMIAHVRRILEQEGYVASVKEVNASDESPAVLRIALKYGPRGENVRLAQ